MTIHEQAKAARALANALFADPCAQVVLGASDACLLLEETRKPLPHGAGPRGFDRYDTDRLCHSCRAYWYAEMAAQTLERTAKFSDSTFTPKDPKETIR